LYPLELIASFGVQYFILSLIFTTILLILWRSRYLKNKVLIFAALALVSLNAVDILPWYLPHPQQNNDELSKPTRIEIFNVNYQNDRYKKVIDAVRKERPDVALFIEVDSNWTKRLKIGLNDILPHIFQSPGGNLTLFSRLPMQDARREFFNGTAGNQSLLATLEIDGKAIQFIGIHAFLPINRSILERRNSHLAALEKFIQNSQKPVILAGDFNLTPRSPYYRQLVQKTRQHNTRLGYGILPSWPRSATHGFLPTWLIPLINIPIDHCLVSQHFSVSGIHTGDNANSDHAPLIVDLILKG
jgi:endonuclease/exonuclease/phosphatase (EEP) superfamily protein YafD